MPFRYKCSSVNLIHTQSDQTFLGAKAEKRLLGTFLSLFGFKRRAKLRRQQSGTKLANWTALRSKIYLKPNKKKAAERAIKLESWTFYDKGHALVVTQHSDPMKALFNGVSRCRWVSR